MTQKTFEELAIANRRRDHLYWTGIPNVIWFFDLSPADFKLYNTIVKTTGMDGRATCFKTTETLSQESGLSYGAISNSKANLARAGLIMITTKKRSKGGRPIDHIEIVDIWEENMMFFKRVFSSDEKTRRFSSLNELKARVFSFSEPIGSPGETEEEPLNKNQKGEEEAASSSLTEQTLSTANGFKEVFTAYVNTFGSLLSSFQAERFKDLWEDYPELEIHEVARNEMYKAMMRKQNPVAPNLNYYAKCLDTERRRNWVIVEEEEDETGKT